MKQIVSKGSNNFPFVIIYSDLSFSVEFPCKNDGRIPRYIRINLNYILLTQSKWQWENKKNFFFLLDSQEHLFQQICLMSTDIPTKYR